MAADDELIRAYDEELGPEPIPRSNKGFWVVAGTMLVGGMFLIVEIFANRPLANSIGHAQDSLRRAQAAAEIVHSRTASFEEADPGSLEDDVPDLSFRSGRRGVVRPRRRQRVRVRSVVGGGRPDPAGRLLLHPPARRGGRALRRRHRVHGRGRPPRRGPPLVAWRAYAVAAASRARSGGRRRWLRRSRARPRGSASCTRGCAEATTVAPVETTASAFSRIRRPDISGSVTL